MIPLAENFPTLEVTYAVLLLSLLLTAVWLYYLVR